MNKSIYLAAVAALALTACSNETDGIFNQSAAERLEQYKKEYAEVLVADGGLWTMEYFANPDEPGYVFVMKFNADGSVVISANHKWIGSSFKQETSLWKMIADNGPVLSFNSYNTLFHIFSDPANITGPNAPTGDYGDIDETGYGHEGDYEFQVMEVSDDGNTVRMLGKKRMYDIFLHRLDAATDPADYLALVKNVEKRFSKNFNDLVMTDADGKLYRVNDMYTGIPSVYPLDGDKVEQTVSGNGIFTLSGFRFQSPLEVKRANKSTFEVKELFFAEDGSLYGENVADLRCASPIEILIRKDLTWTLDEQSLTGKAKTLYDAANAALVDALSAKDTLGASDFTYGSVGGKMVPQFVTRIGTRVCRDYIEYELSKNEKGDVLPSDQLHFSITGGNNTAVKYDGEVPAYKAFKDYLTGKFVMTLDDPLSPSSITMKDASDSSSSFVVTMK